MKQKTILLLLIALVILVRLSICFAGFGFGMPGAVKNRVEKLDEKVRDKKDKDKKGQDDVDDVVKKSISGTVAKGEPIVLAAVTLKDSNGSQKSTTTGNNGKYNIDVTDLTLPCMIKVTEGTTTYFSIAITSGTCNIHPFTDIVTRLYFWLNKGITNLEDAFENNYASLGTLPTAEVIDAIKDVIMDIVSDILDRNGIDSLTYDIFTTNFDADSTGFDKVIEETQFTINPSSSTVEIKDITSGQVISTFTYISSGSTVTITRVAVNPIEVNTSYQSSYNILLAQASGGNPPYTFMLETGVGFQPMGMTLVTEGSSCYLRGNPSAGSESPFERTFGLCAKDLSGNYDCADPRFTYIVTAPVIWSGPYSVTRIGDGGCTYNNSGTLTMNITIDGNQFSGTCQLDGIELRWIEDCSFAKYTTGDGTISGDISGNTISNGTLTYTVPEIPGKSVIWSWSAIISGDTLNGITPEGSFTLTRQSSSPAPALAPKAIQGIPNVPGRALGF